MFDRRCAVKTAVITTARGRGEHLRRQLRGLSRSTRLPDIHVVVAVGDPEVADIVTATGSPVHVVACNDAVGSLPIAAARNTGAQAALHRAPSRSSSSTSIASPPPT